MKPLLLCLLSLACTIGLGCQRISAREVLPDYVKKKEAAAAAKQAEPEPAQANPPTFFPGQKID
jgi:hypothetical protein